MKIIFLVAVSFLLYGCSGTLYTVLNPDITIKDSKEKKVKGVLAYKSLNVIELYQLMALVDKSSGNVIGNAPDDCTPQKTIKFSVRADYSNPYLIEYDAGYFETNKFGVTLKDGILTGVNVESDPSKSISAVAEFIPLAALLMASTADEKPLCNAQPKFIGLFKAPEIQPFSAMPTE